MGDKKLSTSILWIDDHETEIRGFAESVKARLDSLNISVEFEFRRNPAEGQIHAQDTAKAGHPFRIVICDLAFETQTLDYDGLRVIEKLQNTVPATQILIFSRHLKKYRERLTRLRPCPILVIKERAEQDVGQICNALIGLLSAENPRILHISDLHFGSHHGFNNLQYSLADTFFGPGGEVTEFIRPRQPNIVIISGDIGSTAELSDYGIPNPSKNNALGFLNELLEQINLSPENCLIVPGNHDVHLSNSDEQKWSSFSRFLKDFYTTNDNDNPLFDCYHGKDRILDTQLVEQRDLMICKRFNEFRTIIVGFNSNATKKTKGRSSPKRAVYGYVGSDQLRLAHDFFSQDNEDFFRIAILHHPLFAVPDASAPDEQGVIEQDRVVTNWGMILKSMVTQDKVKLIFHGHSHYPAIQQYGLRYLPRLGNISEKSLQLHVTSAGCLGAIVKYRQPAFPYFHYQIITTTNRSSESGVNNNHKWQAKVEARRLANDALSWENVVELISSTETETGWFYL